MKREEKKTRYELWVVDKYLSANSEHMYHMDCMWNWAYGEENVSPKDAWDAQQEVIDKQAARILNLSNLVVAVRRYLDEDGAISACEIHEALGKIEIGEE